MECKSFEYAFGHKEVHADLIKNGSSVDLILSWDNELIQMSLTDARKEIEAILRGIIDGPEASSLTKQTEKSECNMSSITWTTSAGFHTVQGQRGNLDKLQRKSC